MGTNNFAGFMSELGNILPKERIYTDELRTLGWGTDASFYRLTPKVVVRSDGEQELSKIVKLASKFKMPYTFRAAGTSLSGQSVSDSVLIVAGKNWEKYEIGEGQNSIRLQPGIVGSRVNEILKPYGRVFPPDPASIGSAMVGGIVCNNASGMNCGVHANSDRMLISARIILADGTIKTLDGASFSEGTLTLNFSATSPATIAAGTPFIVKWDKAEETEDTENTEQEHPIFNDVTISNTLNYVNISGVLTFKGIFSPYAIEGEDRTLLYLGGDNKLYYPNGAMTIGACRAYFKLADGLTAGEPTTAGAKGINNFVLNFNDDETTGITTTNYTNSTNSCDAWYSIDGRHLTGKPTQKGVYINNGKQIVIK